MRRMNYRTWMSGAVLAVAAVSGTTSANLFQSSPPLAPPPPRGGAARPPATKPTTPAPTGTPKAPTARPPATPTPTAPGASAPTAPTGTPDGLAAEPLVLESLGLRFRPPANTVMRADGTGLNASWTLSERADPTRFILRVSRLVASTPESSPAQQMDGLVKAANEHPATDTVFKVLDRREFTVAGQPAGLLYTSLREGSGDEAVTATQGYLLIQTETNEFIVISSLIAETDFAAMRALLERSYGTIALITSDEVAKARADRIAAADRLVAGFDEATLRRALDPLPAKATLPAPRWYRITRHLADGTEQESGYMTIMAVEASQGDANPDRKAKDWTPEEREKGLLVRIQARTLLDEKGTTVSDTDSRIWMKWDRSREFWTVRTTARRGSSTRTDSQLGMRLAPSATHPRGLIQVTGADTNGTERDKNGLVVTPMSWPVPPVAYLSQAESYLFPRLLPAGDARADYGFYWYDPRSGRVVLRTDRRRPARAGFVLATQPTPEAPEMDQEFDAAGILRRRESDDGTLIEAIEPTKLLEIWRRKGLPTG